MSDMTTTAARAGRIMAVAVLACAAALAFAASRIEYAFASDPLGPRFFPYLLALALALCALWCWLAPGEADARPDRIGLIHLAAVGLVCVICVALMPSLGFFLSMGLLASAVAYGFAASPAAALLSGFGQALLWWLIFEKALGSNLPVGPLGF